MTLYLLINRKNPLLLKNNRISMGSKNWACQNKTLTNENDNMSFLKGKKILITGVLSNRSIAYGIAKACHEQGAELAFSYVGERFKDRITEFAADFDSKLIFDCDGGHVTSSSRNV